MYYTNQHDPILVYRYLDKNKQMYSNPSGATILALVLPVTPSNGCCSKEDNLLGTESLKYNLWEKIDFHGKVVRSLQINLKILWDTQLLGTLKKTAEKTCLCFNRDCSLNWVSERLRYYKNPNTRIIFKKLFQHIVKTKTKQTKHSGI